MHPQSPDRVRATVRGGLAAAGISIAAALLVFGGTHLAVGAVSDRVLRDPAGAGTRSVAIVPGAGLARDGSPLGILEGRLACAKDLYERGLVGSILVSGDGELPSHDETSAMQRWLVANGLPEERIQMDFRGLRTRTTMERAARIHGVRDAVICTQELHANRTVFLALVAGIDAVAVVARGDQWLGTGAWLRERGATMIAVFETLLSRRQPY